jgi:hypothetical protein
MRRAMERSVIARGAAGAAVVVACAALGPSLGLGPDLEGEARADDAKAAAPVSGPLCAIKGTHPIPKGTQIFDAPTGGRAVANFTGSFVPMQLSDFPADPTTGRVAIRTSTGSGALRIDGYISASSIPVFTARDISVSGGHVWISTAQRVRLVQAANNSLTVELSPLGTTGQTVRATAACDAFSLQQGTPTAMEVPGNGRGYLTKSTSIDFYDGANGNAIFTLKMTESASQLFWSTESRAGFVHVRSRADLTIDAWETTTRSFALRAMFALHTWSPTAPSGGSPPRVGWIGCYAEGPGMHNRGARVFRRSRRNAASRDASPRRSRSAKSRSVRSQRSGSSSSAGGREASSSKTRMRSTRLASVRAWFG